MALIFWEESVIFYRGEEWLSWSLELKDYGEIWNSHQEDCPKDQLSQHELNEKLYLEAVSFIVRKFFCIRWALNVELRFKKSKTEENQRWRGLHAQQ